MPGLVKVQEFTPNPEFVAEAKEFFSTVEMDESEVLAQIREERSRSIDFVRSKREQFVSDLRLFNNQKSDDEMIGDTTMFNVHDALVARDFSDRVQVQFTGSIGGTPYADKATIAYREDYSSDDYQIRKYQLAHDRFFFGVAVEAFTGWNGTTKSNKVQIVDPFTFVPDVTGDYLSWDYRYVGFDKTASLSTIKNSGYLNSEDVTAGSEDDEGAKAAARKRAEAAGFTYIEDQLTSEGAKAELYVHFGTFNGHKAMVLTGNSQGLILRASLIKAGNPQTEKDPSLIRFPFAFHYFRPRRGDPFGFCVGDFTRDVQRHKSRIANLRYKKMKAELYPMYLFNKNYVAAKDIQFGFNKAIPVNPGIGGPMPMDNIMTPLRKDLRVDTSMAVDQTLDKQIERSTGISDISLGSTPEQRETLGTNQLGQANSDIKISLNSKIAKFGHRQHVRLWLEGYYRNFKSADSKLVSAPNGIGWVPMKLKKSDFLADWNMSFDVLMGDEISAEKDKKRLALTQAASIVLADPTAPKVAKDYINRQILIANGMEPQQANMAVMTSPEEYVQLTENQLLLNGIEVEVSPDDDDLTHLAVLEQAGDSVLVELHRMAHIMQYASKGKNPVANAEPMGNIASQAMAQIGSLNSNAVANNPSPLTNG